MAKGANRPASPFELVAVRGDFRLTLFSGGACLIVEDGTEQLQSAWEWFEEELDSAQHCYAALFALFELARHTGAHAAFYPVWQKPKAMLSRPEMAQSVPV